MICKWSSAGTCSLRRCYVLWGRQICGVAEPVAKLIVGCGYLGGRVARLWREAGEQIWVLTRSADKALRLGREGFSTVVADLNSIRDLPPSLFPAQGFSTVLYSVGYDR